MRLPRSRTLPMLGMLTLLLGSTLIPLVYGDVVDSFDTYTPGTISPGTWSFSSSNSGCLSGVVTQDPAAKSLPNDYQILEAANCNIEADHAKLQLLFNATSNTSTISWWQLLVASTGSVPVGDTLALYVNGAQVYPALPTAPVAINTISGASWTQISGTIFTTAGASSPSNTGVYNMTFKVVTVTSVSSYTFALGFDNVIVNNGNIITPNYNFVTMDYATGQWFNMSQFKDSNVQVGYPTIVPFNQNTTIPDLNLPLTGANLITVNVGTDYYRTIIPPTLGGGQHIIMWLDNPNSTRVIPYNLQIVDLTNAFPASSTTFYIYRGNIVNPSTGSINAGSHILVTSGYLDGSYLVVPYLTPALYTIEFQNGNAFYAQTLNLGSNTGPISIYINNIKLSNPSNPFTSINWATGWDVNAVNIIFAYNDTSDSTTSFTVSILRSNATCFECASGIPPVTKSSGPYGYVQFLIGCASDDCNSTIASSLYVKLNVVSTQYGNFNLGPQPVNGLAANGLFTNVPTIPDCLFGFCFFNSNPQALTGVGATILLAAVGGVFGAVAAPIGAVVMAVLFSIFVGIGVINILPSVAAGFIALVFFSFLSYLRKKSAQG